jgi:hypothetical protein
LFGSAALVGVKRNEEYSEYHAKPGPRERGRCWFVIALVVGAEFQTGG